MKHSTSKVHIHRYGKEEEIKVSENVTLLRAICVECGKVKEHTLVVVGGQEKVY